MRAAAILGLFLVLGPGCVGDPPALADASSGGGADSSSTAGESSTGSPPTGFVDLGPLPCVPEGRPVGDFIAGDTSGVSCELGSGIGSGDVPDGLELTAGCVVDDSNATGPERYGMSAFIVEVTLDSDTQFVPFCEYLANPQAGEYPLDIQGGGMSWSTDMNDLDMMPFRGTFRAGEPISFGSPGDPAFATWDQGICSDTECDGNFGAEIIVNDSLFAPTSLSEQMPVGSESVGHGMGHGLALQGDPVPAALEQRPFIVELYINYCLAPDLGSCTLDGGPLPGYNNAGSNVSIAVVMFPE